MAGNAPTQQATVVENEARSRFELHEADELIGFASYVVEDGQVVFVETVIDPERRGSGLGQMLVRAAVERVRARGEVPAARCPFVAAYLDSHPGQSSA